MGLVEQLSSVGLLEHILNNEDKICVSLLEIYNKYMYSRIVINWDIS